MVVPLTMPEHAPDRLAAQALAQGPHERDAAGHRRLEQQVPPGRVGGGEQLGADVGQQLLVGRDDRLAVLAARSRISSRAGSMPPMTSTTTSIVGVLDHRVGVAGEHGSGAGRRRARGTGCARRPGRPRAADRCGPRWRRPARATSCDQRRARRCRSRARRPARRCRSPRSARVSLMPPAQGPSFDTRRRRSSSTQRWVRVRPSGSRSSPS